MNDITTRGVFDRPAPKRGGLARVEARAASPRPHRPEVSGVRRGLCHGPRVWQGPATF